jgi:hypothetical protein
MRYHGADIKVAISYQNKLITTVIGALLETRYIEESDYNAC